MSYSLNQTDIALLTAVCDTFAPALADTDDPHGYFSRPASALGVPQAMAAALAALPSDDDRAEVRLLLGVLHSPASALVLIGKARRFSRLAAEDRERFLLRMASSPLPQLRSGYQVLKRLSLALFHGLADARGRNPNWPALGYSGPIGTPPGTPRPITPLLIAHDTTLDCDVVVIGSGAGGGVVAGELAMAGKSVVVLEQGGYYAEDSYSQLELDMLGKLYLDGGNCTSRDRAITVLAGACLGGGTVVNYSTSFRTPERVRHEWASQRGLPWLASTEFDRSLDAVSARINVNRYHNRPASREELMYRGLRGLGWHVDAMPRNVAHCSQDDQCGFCGLGCQSGSKQSTLKTYLQDAYDHGARIVVRASAQRVLLAGGRAVGVTATVSGDDGRQHSLMVRARAVVVACGAIHTPALLLRSGLRNPNIGCGLRLHPAAAMWGRFATPVRPWTGTLQALYSDQLVDMDGQGYGAKFETAPIHPLIPSIACAWEGGRQFKALMTGYAHYAPVGVLLRDRDGGQIRINRQGLPVIDYQLSAYDQRHLRRGLHAAAQVLCEAGATELFTSQVRYVHHQVGAEPFDAFLARADAVGYGPNQTAVYTFHQMASCPMGNNPRTAAVDGEHQAYGVRGLFVADASTFPGASGVNPMLTIMALAHRAARVVQSVV